MDKNIVIQTVVDENIVIQTDENVVIQAVVDENIVIQTVVD